MIATTIATLAAALPGVAASPQALQVHNVSRAQAKRVVLAWQTSNADTWPVNGDVATFRFEGYRWRCHIDYDRDLHPWDFVRCVTGKHRHMRFSIRWPWQGNGPGGFDNSVRGCANPTLLSGLTVVVFGMTKGIGCSGARDLMQRIRLPDHDNTFHPPGWLCQAVGYPGNGSTPNGMLLQCFSQPNALTDLSQTDYVELTWPTTSTILCQPTPHGCTWEGH